MRKHKIGGNQKVKKFFASNKDLHGKRVFKIQNDFVGWCDKSDSKSETCIYPKVVAKMIYYK